ncbi:MAG: GNAT family N-acetyltransferase [Hyphomicrobium sp.]|jgi:putative acetyltransferase
MQKQSYPIRPFMLADTMALRDLFAQSIEELTGEDYTEDQRLAWIATAEDAEEFADRLEAMVTLVVNVDGEYLGFAALKDNLVLDMLYVHPYATRRGVGTTLADALERLATARGAKSISVEASDSAQPFFAKRGYVPGQRNIIPIEDQWLSNTTMTKPLAGTSEPAKRTEKKLQ